MRRFSLAPSFVDRVLTLVRMHDVQIAATPKSVKRTLADMGGDTELFQALIYLKRADALAQSELGEPRLELADELQVVLDAVIANGDAFTLKQLDVSGRDLMAIGIAEGPAVGHALNQCLDAVIEGRVRNERAQLLEFAQSLETAPQ